MIELTEIHAIDQCTDLEIRQRMLSSKKAKFTKHFIARKNGDEIGFLAVDIIPSVDYLVLYELFVPSRVRGLGLGVSLVGEVEKLELR